MMWMWDVCLCLGLMGISSLLHQKTAGPGFAQTFPLRLFILFTLSLAVRKWIFFLHMWVCLHAFAQDCVYM